MKDKQQGTIYDEIIEAYACISSKHMKEAFEHARNAAVVAPEQIREIATLEEQYFYMLRFIATNNKIEDLDSVLQNLGLKLKDTIRRIEIKHIAETESTVYSGMLRYALMRPEETPETLVSDYLSEFDRLKTDTEALTDTRRRACLERISSDIFNRLLVESPVSDETVTLLSNILSDNTIPQHDRILWIHAIGLSLLRHDDRLFELLYTLHSSNDAKISTAAAVWLVLAYNIPGYRISREHFEECHPEDYPNVIFEWCRATGTKTDKDFFSSINPKILKLGSELSDKLRELDHDDAGIIPTPEWLSDNVGPEGYDAIKSLIESQRNGDDFFLASLGKMRHFDFFKSMSNWFLPFHTDHSSLSPIVDGEGAAIADTIEQMHNMCDSDKYALLLSMTQTPEHLKSTTFGAISEPIHMFMNSDETRDLQEQLAISSRTNLINNHIKNIHRFFAFNSAAKDFRNPFNPPLLHLCYVNLSKYPQIYGRTADALFRTGLYSNAIDIYNALDSREQLSVERYFNLAKALEYDNRVRDSKAVYEKILDIDFNNVSARMRIAEIIIGNRADYNIDQAIAILTPVANSISNDVECLALLAQVYTLAEQWSEALGIYHNIDYLLSDNDNSVKGKIAWLLTLFGEYDEAQYYFELAEKTPENLRYHSALCWITDKPRDAVALAIEADKIDGIKSVEASIVIGHTYLMSRVPQAKNLRIIDDIKAYSDGDDNRFGTIL